MIGYIYKIYDNTNGNVYYGSTKETVSRRMTNHRAKYKKYIEGKGNFTKSYDILKNNDYSYSVVEKVEFNEKYELHQKERYYIENNECINKNIPNRTQIEYDKEYYEKNKDKINLKCRNYRKDNNDKMKEYNKEYYEKNKDKIKEKRKSNVLKNL